MVRLIAIFFVLTLCAVLAFLFIYIPYRATRVYGAPVSSLSFPQRVQYSALLLWYDGLLTPIKSRTPDHGQAYCHLLRSDSVRGVSLSIYLYSISGDAGLRCACVFTLLSSTRPILRSIAVV